MSGNASVEFYGPGAITSDNITDDQAALIRKASDVEVIDGGELVDVTLDDDDQDGENSPEGEKTPEGEKAPEDESKKDTKEDPDAGLRTEIKAAQTAILDLANSLTAKGVDVAPLVAELESTGNLSEGSYKTLADAGFPQTVVDAIIAGQNSVNERFTNAIFAVAGGAENFKALTDFARVNDPEAVSVYNDALDRGDLKAASLVLKNLQAARTAKLGTANKQITGNPTKTAKAVQGFATAAEMTKAMADPKYRSDAAYRKTVEARVGASKFLG